MRRCSAAVAYLRPAMKRPNLTVETRALGAARAVRGQARGRSRISRRTARCERVRARREVLLAGGSLQSPQLLQLSGVGPAALLREHGIDVVHELPGVGENLQDHLGCRVIYKARRPTRSTRSRAAGCARRRPGSSTSVRRRGAADDGGGADRPVRPTREPGSPRPIASTSSSPAASTSRASRCTRSPAARWSAIPCRPESRGWLRIKSPDPSGAAGDAAQLPRRRATTRRR